MIIIIYSVYPIFTNPPDWRKALSNGVKTHLFKLKTSKLSRPPPPHPARVGEKNDFLERGGGMIEMHNIYPCKNMLRNSWNRLPGSIRSIVDVAGVGRRYGRAEQHAQHGRREGGLAASTTLSNIPRARTKTPKRCSDTKASKPHQPSFSGQW